MNHPIPQIPQTLQRIVVGSPSGDSRRGKNRDFTLREIRLLSPDPPGMRFEGYDETHKTQNVRITGLTRNGIPVTAFDQTELTVNPFAENITIEE